jgi:peptidoglycan/LPS O-acetylase OafA/YrhL
LNTKTKSKLNKKRGAIQGPRFPLLGYRPDIDGLRALAVLSVIGFHAFPTAVHGGFAGVDVFFVISGFLISNQILHRLERGDFTLSDFYARRVRRIFPALIVLLAACFALGWFALFANEYAQLGKHIAAGASFLSNFVLWQESGYFDTNSRLKPLLHLWSLGVEEQFYLIWPLTLLLTFRLRLKALAVVVTVLVASFALNIYYIGHDASGAFYLPVTRFWELMSGALLACAFSSPKGSHRRPGDQPRYKQSHKEWASVTGLLLVIAAFWFLRERTAYPGTWALLPTFGAFLLLSAGPDAWVNRHIMANRGLVLIGLISYPLYLWHWSLLSFGDIVQSGSLSTRARFVIILASFVLATITYLLVERPIRFGGKTPAVAFGAAGFLIVAGVAGWVAFNAGGLPSRAANLASNFANDMIVPVSTYSSDGSCTLVALDQIRNELCLSVGRHPEILLAGDSHAIALNAGPFLGQVPLRTLLIATNSCLPFLDYVTFGPNERKQDKICTDLAKHTLEASRSHPEIRNVILSTRGPFYFSGAAFGVEAQDPSRNNWKIEPVRGEDGGATNQERFLRGYSQLISRLEEYGKTVTFVIDVPELGIEARTCIPGRPFTFAPPTVSPCTVLRTMVDQRQAEYRKIVRSLAADHPRLKVFDPLPLFCDETLCYGRDDAHLLYRDTNHLTVHGSQVVWKALLPSISQESR